MDRRYRVAPCLRHLIIGHGIGMVDAIRKQLGIDRSATSSNHLSQSSLIRKTALHGSRVQLSVDVLAMPDRDHKDDQEVILDRV